jgi:hypothetical protein
LVELRDAGRLDANRIKWIPGIEDQIAALGEAATAPPAVTAGAREERKRGFFGRLFGGKG